MATPMLPCCLRWGLLLLTAVLGDEAAAQLGGSNAGSPPGTYSLPNRSLDKRPQAKRIFFPPDPPPLGAQINIDPRRPPTAGVPSELAGHVAELFYAPLSTCLDDFSLFSTEMRETRLRLEAYARSREELLAELRATVSTQTTAPAEERVTAFAALAQRHAAALAQLEAEAETLRADLAKEASWYDLRKWKLGAGALREHKPEHRLLEFQLVRAAAFYQPGLSPPQRRLLREAAVMMQDEVFAAGASDTASGPAPPKLVFFAPDLVRLLPRPDMPPALIDELEAFVAEKDQLREELAAAVLAVDKTRFASERRSTLVRLAAAQADRLAALELRAEDIRREYAPNFENHRMRQPHALPHPLLTRIENFLSERAARQAEIDQRLRGATRQVQSTYRGRDPRELQDLVVQARQEVINRFTEANAVNLLELETELEQIHDALVACVGEAALQTGSRSSSAFLTEYLAKYRQAWAYYEYEIAVFQVGLSAAQRRLLIGGAVRWLDLPLPRAEFQPTELPHTLLNEEQKLSSVGLP